ncbi:MAG: SOS response-associated peptidase [Akkermansiaceae bacterium]
MCNAFNTAKNPFQIAGNIVSGETCLIRRTDSAPVWVSANHTVEMRWGFERKGLGCVNNSRSDHLESAMWREAFRDRRCLIPLAFYYEWSGSKGQKRAYRFRALDGGWLWTAGIWEDSSEYGRCFSMLTTEANKEVVGIHHRMPALLTESEQKSYLNGEMSEFCPQPGLLLIEDAPNPLKNKPEFEQGELW